MPDLIDKISSESYLRSAWNKLNKANLDSYGVSGATLAKFRENLDDRLASISKSLRKGSYKFSPSRAAVLKKDNGKFRPLQIPEIQDRIVLKAIALELESIFEPIIIKSKGVSFAYQKGIGVKDAIERLDSLHKMGYDIVLEADIVNFFGEVNREVLLNSTIFPGLPDASLNELIRNGLSQPVSGIDTLSKEEAKAFDNIGSGIPQGNPLSPLFSNLYLSPFDLYMKSNNYQLIRYADDFIVLHKNIENATECFKKASEFLKNKLGLSVHDLNSDKSNIVTLGEDRFVFLSVEHDGKEYFPSIESFTTLKNKIIGVCKIDVDSITIIELLTKVKNRLEGWLSAYYYTKLERYLEELDYLINREIYLALRKFEWRLTSNSISNVPVKYSNGLSRDCLSKHQRKSSGIPISADIILKMRSEKIPQIAALIGDF